MSEELIEALAATIACNSPSGLQYPWHRKAAQAILSELSAAGPTEEMIVAGEQALIDNEKYLRSKRTDAIDVFEAMMRAMLKARPV